MPTLFCEPGPGPAPGCARPARSTGASKPGARSGAGRHVPAPQQPTGARSATRRLRTWIHTPSRKRNLVEHGIVLPPAAGRAEVDTHPADCEPPGRGHAVDRASALTPTTGRYRRPGRTRPHRQEAGPARWATLVARHRPPRLGGPPQGPGRPAWCAVRPHPPRPRTARRRDDHDDMGPGERNGPPPAPGAPPPRATTCPKAPPSPATNPYPGAIASEPGNRPRTTLDHPTPQETPAQLITTTP